MSKFRYTFLTKIRYRTRNKDRVEKCIWQFGKDKETGEYTLSLLGVINGLLPLLPFSPVLVVSFDEETKKIKKWWIAKKWW